ncbi:MAG: hypothetical protein ACE5FL_06195 [Myxococcota bacterium]
MGAEVHAVTAAIAVRAAAQPRAGLVQGDTRAGLGETDGPDAAQEALIQVMRDLRQLRDPGP